MNSLVACGKLTFEQVPILPIEYICSSHIRHQPVHIFRTLERFPLNFESRLDTVPAKEASSTAGPALQSKYMLTCPDLAAAADSALAQKTVVLNSTATGAAAPSSDPDIPSAPVFFGLLQPLQKRECVSDIVNVTAEMRCLSSLTFFSIDEAVLFDLFVKFSRSLKTLRTICAENSRAELCRILGPFASALPLLELKLDIERRRYRARHAMSGATEIGPSKLLLESQTAADEQEQQSRFHDGSLAVDDSEVAVCCYVPLAERFEDVQVKEAREQQRREEYGTANVGADSFLPESIDYPLDYGTKAVRTHIRVESELDRALESLAVLEAQEAIKPHNPTERGGEII